MSDKENVINIPNDTDHNILDIGIHRWIVSRSILCAASEIWDYEEISCVTKFLNALERFRYYTSYDMKTSTLCVMLFTNSDIDDVLVGLSLVCEFNLLSKIEILGIDLDAFGETLRDAKVITIHHILDSSLSPDKRFLIIDCKASVIRNECIHDICERIMNVDDNSIGDVLRNEAKSFCDCTNFNESED